MCIFISAEMLHFSINANFRQQYDHKNGNSAKAFCQCGAEKV